MFADIINQIKEKKPEILVLGDLMLDKFILGDVDRISPEAPVPIVKIDKEEQMLGGCGNVIRNLSNLGVKAYLVSVVGQDQSGDSLIDLLLKQNISISSISRLESIQTTEKIRIIADRQQIVRLDREMKNLGILKNQKLHIDNISKIIKSVDGVIISDYAKGVCSQSFLTEVFKISKDSNIPVYVDPKGSNWGKYKNASLITPNIKEAEIILGKKLKSDEDCEIAGEKICSAYDIEACLITRGGDGMSFFSKNNTFHLKSNAKEIFDVSGAGDTVISAMATGLVMGLPYKRSAEFSNQAAGIVVGHIGTSAITTRELLNFN